MRAAVVRKHGSPDTLSIEIVTDPVLGRGEVVVQVRAVAANFVDLLVIEGAYQFLPRLPFVPGKLPAGTYYVTASALVNLGAGDSGVLCFIALNGDTNHELSQGGDDGGPFVQAAEIVAVSVHANDRLSEWCSVQGNAGGTTVNSAGITAIRVLSSAGTKPVR